jgi:hypothetical protein
MKTVAGALSLPAVVLFAVAAFSTPQTTPKFVPPELTSLGEVHTHIGEIHYPIDTLTSGVVSLLVSLDSSGHIEDIAALQDIPALTAVSLTAVQNWTFSPASYDGRQIPSGILVDVVFNPSNFRVTDGPAIHATTGSARETLTQLQQATQFSLPTALNASFAEYPVNSVGFGSVTTDVHLSAAGEETKVTIVQGLPSLNSNAIAAAKKWNFKPATFQGAAVPSKVILVFVFRSLNISSP